MTPASVKNTLLLRGRSPCDPAAEAALRSPGFGALEAALRECLLFARSVFFAVSSREGWQKGGMEEDREGGGREGGSKKLYPPSAVLLPSALHLPLLSGIFGLVPSYGCCYCY